MTDETTDRVPKSALRMTGEWVREKTVQPVVDHTALIISLVESGDRKDQMTIRMLVGLAGAFLLLLAVLLTLLMGGSFQATRDGVTVNAPTINVAKEATP